MSDVLDAILAYKRDEVAALRAARSVAELEAQAHAASDVRGFAKALLHSPYHPALIAEIKRASPSKGLIRANFDPPALACAYEAGGAACLSVLTDGPSFQGDAAFLVAARAACRLPTLRKDFMIDPLQVIEARTLGADAILIIMAAVDDACADDLHACARTWGMDTLAECHDPGEVSRALRLDGALIGVNNRNLRSFETNLSTTADLATLIPRDRVLVSESGIFTPADAALTAAAGARAILVGEALMRAADVGAATRALLQPGFRPKT
jgi:indole-3-glycerol phosphate synthase